MTSRPPAASKHRRPLSAIFLGPQAQPPPELPDPPSAVSSPGSSGLPSPPASNSTGSGPGSNGGDLSNESIRVPASLSLTMKKASDDSGGNALRSRSLSRSGSRASSRSRSPSDDGDALDDDDHTARLSGGPGPSTRSNPDSNESALERVKNLTQRNRLVLNKLASLSSGSRLVSPAPTSGPRRSPAPSTSANSVRSSSTSVRRRSESVSRASGSETERENANVTSDSEGLSETPTSTTGTHFRSASLAESRSSASTLKQDKDKGKDILPDRTARGRSVELAATGDLGSRRYSILSSALRPQSRAEDIETAALAAVAKSRGETSPVVETRRGARQPLPREFPANESSLGHGLPPQTPRRERTVSGSTYSSSSIQDSPSSSRATMHDSPMSPRTRLHRYSTVRDITRRNQTRWLSQDLSPLKNGVSASDLDVDTSPTKRRGSGDVGDSPRRNFVGESLRAAGLVKLREENEDVFGGGGGGEAVNRRLRISSEVGVRPSRLEGTSSRPGTRFSERPVASDSYTSNTHAHTMMEPKTPATAGPVMGGGGHYVIAQRNVQSASNANVRAAEPSRPSTSMERYREREEPLTAPLAFRLYKSVELGSGPDRPVSQLRQHAMSSAASSAAGVSGHERSGSSVGVRRSAASPFNLASVAAAAAGGDGTPEHTRLMLESLGMFESQLSRLPSLGSTTTVTIPELFRSAQNIVHSADALSNMLRRGTAHALEEQIDAELGEDGRPIDLVSLWRDVGAEYRESVRVSDELVRTMTSFLLGVGKVLREAMSNSSPALDNSMHNRTMSMDGSPRRRFSVNTNTPESALQGDGSRSSMDGKSTRWMLSSGDTGVTGRTTTSFTSLHSAGSTASFRRLTGMETEGVSDRGEVGGASRKLARLSQSSLLSGSTATAGGKAVESPLDTRANVSIDTDGGTLDSPAAAAAARREERERERERGTLARRSNTVAVLPPLSTLPSESLVSRRSSERERTSNDSKDKPSASTSGAASITRRAPRTSLTRTHARTATSILHVSSGSTEPTTAVNTTQASPERPRHISTSSTLSGALSQRKRTVSVSSVVEALNEATAGRERERERQREREGEIKSRVRTSFDSATSGSTAREREREAGGGEGRVASGTFSGRTVRDRRETRTVSSIFSRT